MMCPRMQDLFLVVVYNLLDLFFLLFFDFLFEFS